MKSYILMFISIENISSPSSVCPLNSGTVVIAYFVVICS